ncbi:MAG: thermonuclease family protein [Candidatus Aenigmatarchaeota archaeon]|nr:thermonuclease family protein [Candidatus Aenigmarchaeota archaeon]
MKFRAILFAVIALLIIWLLAYFVHPLIISKANDIVIVTKIIDGDTIIVEGGRDIRLLGIDADEKGEPCYTAAAERLSELILNKQVRLEADNRDKDKYKRYLRWVWLGDRLINEQLVSEGLAIARHNDGEKYTDIIAAAEKSAIENNIGCKWSSDK